jgi:hypothetical protein
LDSWGWEISESGCVAVSNAVIAELVVGEAAGERQKQAKTSD